MSRREEGEEGTECSVMAKMGQREEAKRRRDRVLRHGHNPRIVPINVYCRPW